MSLNYSPYLVCRRLRREEFGDACCDPSRNPLALRPVARGIAGGLYQGLLNPHSTPFPSTLLCFSPLHAISLRSTPLPLHSAPRGFTPLHALHSSVTACKLMREVMWPHQVFMTCSRRQSCQHYIRLWCRQQRGPRRRHFFNMLVHMGLSYFEAAVAMNAIQIYHGVQLPFSMLARQSLA